MATPVPEYATPEKPSRLRLVLLGLLVGIAMTPAALLLAFLSAGAGHGSYALTRALFPLPMLATRFTHRISMPLIVAGTVQFPLYGLIVDMTFPAAESS